MDPHAQFLTFVRSAVKQGANRVMKKAGFKRPGGGRRFLRDVGPFHQEFDYAATWVDGEVGELQLRLIVTSPGHRGATLERELPLDVESQDPSDLAVSLCHWLTTEAFAWFDRANETVRSSPLPVRAPPQPREGDDLPF